MFFTDDNKMNGYILHKNKDRITFFSFQENNNEPSSLVKVYDQSRKALLQEKLTFLQQVMLTCEEPLKDSIPKILDLVDAGRYCLIFEEYTGGSTMAELAQHKHLFWQKSFTAHLSLSSEWLAGFHKKTVQASVVIPADKIAFLFDKISSFIPKPFVSVAHNDVAIPLVSCHGDFRPANIVLKKGKVVVLDWDNMRRSGLPLLDLLEFILRYVHSRFRLQKKDVYLLPESFLAYFNLFYARESTLSAMVKDKINWYASSLGLAEREKNVLLLIWLYKMLYINEKDKFACFPEGLRELLV
ncbi:MAG: phosphotransferase [Candidatus Omnitrophota bacterium]|jgi:serine/threonine protein kinase